MKMKYFIHVSFFALFAVIVDAIVLLTGKFDRNLVYRQELKKTGNTEPDTLGQMVAIMGIALPTMGGNKNT